ncbi:Maf family nucleotide pyrophosphatase [Kaistella rhinocerotis]|uniref:Maf family nucleotide pyrophosphatase n=1 Tax=Kaistella rhinocerotis TaxID=3026437 RepID=UPI0025569DA0|nr:Maf family nucleotide pyrophosphatase [Kaistella sp. Ran72]
MKILLASNSPRRRELLQNLGYDFDVVSVECLEVFPDQMPAKEVAEYLSVLKSDAYNLLEKDEILITADTTVVLGEEILGKPADEEDARLMLKKLSDKTHQVYTGITIRSIDKIISATDVADVDFDILNDDEINYYIKNFKPYDKAGSYGVQEWLGMAKIRQIRGSFYTVMGLPTHLVYRLLKEFEK